MLIASINVFKEGVKVGISSQDGKVWGEYYLVGDKADTVFESLAKVMSENDPVIGDKFTVEYKKKKRKKGKK